MKGFFSLYQRNYYLSQSSIVQRQFWRKNYFQGVSNQVGKLPKFQGVGGSKAKCPIWGGMASFWNYIICIQFPREKKTGFVRIHFPHDWILLRIASSRYFPCLLSLYVLNRRPVRRGLSTVLIFICLFLPKNC